MKNTDEKPLLETLKGESLSSPPLWLMRQAGRYLSEYRKVRASAGSFLDLCYTPELAAEVTLQPIKRFGFDAAIIFSDILVIPDAMGMQLDYIEGEGPKLSPVRTREEISHLTTGKISSHLSPVFEALAKVKEELPSHTALIGFAGAPWTVATYMVEGGGSKNFSEVKHLAFSDPKTFQFLLDKLVEATSEYLCGQVEAGAEVLQIFDSWAGVVPSHSFEEWVIKPTKQIVENVKAQHPTIPIIGFPKGAGLHYKDYCDSTGITAVGIDYTVPPSWAARHLQSKMPVQGNLDPVLLASSKEQLLEEVSHIRESFFNKPYIFNLGHGILPHTPIEHVELLIEAVREEQGAEHKHAEHA